MVRGWASCCGHAVLPLSLDDPGAKVTCGSRALVTADKGNGPLCVRSNAYVGAGPVVHRLALHPCSERRQERWISETSRSSSASGVGKSEHWATALSRDGQKVLDKALPNDEDRLREVYQRLQAKGQVLVVVDQPATIGALAVAVAQDMGITVGYLPGLSMRRIADLTPGSAKTDAKDAAVIAGAARSMPHTLRAISTSDEEAAALSMLTGFDLDLARQVNQTANRIRGLYTQIHPALENILGPRLKHDAVLEVIAAWPTPTALRKAGRARIDAGLKKHAARRHAARTNRIIQALTKQTAMVAGTATANTVRPANSSPHAPKRADDGSPVMVDSGWHRPALPAGRRRRPHRVETLVPTLFTGRTSQPGPARPGPPPRHPAPVSYTHLTLPTNREV